MSEELSGYMDDATLEKLGAENNTEISESDGQSETKPEGAETEDKNDSIESQLNAFKDEGEKEVTGKAGDLLTQINALGLVRDGMPFELGDAEQVKEMLQKGFDYTQNNMAAAEVKEKYEADFNVKLDEFEKMEQEFQDKQTENHKRLHEYDVITDIVAKLQTSEPELFAELSSEFQRSMSIYDQQLNSPFVKEADARIKNLESLLKQDGETKTQAENQEITKNWETGLGEVQKEFGVKLKSLGVKPNWEKVKSAWTADATGKMTVKEAFFAAHGADLSKAMEAANKLAKTKAQSAIRMGPPGSADKSEFVDKDGNELSNMDFLLQSAKKHAG